MRVEYRNCEGKFAKANQETRDSCRRVFPLKAHEISTNIPALPSVPFSTSVVLKILYNRKTLKKWAARRCRRNARCSVLGKSRTSSLPAREFLLNRERVVTSRFYYYYCFNTVNISIAFFFLAKLMTLPNSEEDFEYRYWDTIVPRNNWLTSSS